MVFGTIDETITSWVMNDQKYDLMKLAPNVHRLIMKWYKSIKRGWDEMEFLSVTIEEGVAIVTINRPPANALVTSANSGS